MITATKEALIKASKEEAIVQAKPEKKYPTCNVCSTGKIKDKKHKYYTNYGGSARVRYCCSVECVNTVLHTFGKRVSRTNNFKPLFLY